MGELGAFVGSRNPDAKVVNDAPWAATRDVPALACVSAEGLTDGGDRLHFNAASRRRLGARYATAMREVRGRQSPQS